MKRIFVPTQNGTDWQRLLGKPKLHWKKGRSAMSAAACWEDANPNLPAEVLAVLGAANDLAIADLELLAAIPEWEVALPGGATASQTDVLSLARNARNLVVLGVEAKVDEPFGPTLEEKKAKATGGQLDRIAYLESELGRTEPFPGAVRYQLLHRSVSALLTARAFHAPVAVMLVHSFSPASAWRDDFTAFCQELGCNTLSADLFEVPRVNGPRLILGWCKGNEKYLETELPNAL
ncbi:MAG: hypothetical protein O3B01_08605 [Planctomycetota bacterium]|nr:hypothetical protein [Planctomycetota bacterium]